MFMADQVWLPLRQVPLGGVTYQSTCVFPGRLSKIHIWLVVRFNHPEKYESNDKWDGYIPYMMGEKNQWFQTTNQTSMCIMLLMKFSNALFFCTGPMRFWLLWSHGTKPSGFAPSIGLAQAAQVHGIQEFYGSNPEPPLKLVKPQLFWGFLSHRATPSSHL